MICYKCKTNLNLEEGDKISRYETCPKCNTDLRCCKMCKFFDVHSYNECREPVAQRVSDKERSNFCEYFKLTQPNVSTQNETSVLSAANALFKKK